MAGFDPDAYLAQKPEPKAAAFDPDAYLAAPQAGAQAAPVSRVMPGTNAIADPFGRGTLPPVNSRGESNYTPEEKLSIEANTKQQNANMAGGALAGAGSIGATLLTPIDMVTGATRSIGNPERRQAIDAGLTTAGSDTNSGSFKTLKTLAEIAGTAGMGGLLAKGASAIPWLAETAPGFINALGSSGMTTGAAGGNTLANLATRVGGGAIAGGAQAGLVNPEDASMGAAIGGGIPLVGSILKGAAELGKKAIGGTTGAGDEALTQAFRSGKEGGKSAESFTKAMRGDSNMDEVLSMAKQNLESMGQQKQLAYRQGMTGVKADKSVLDMKNISQAVDDSMGMATFKGQVKNESAANYLGKIKQEIDAWKGLDPADFHTPEGLDALKQKIGGIVESIPFEEKTARSAASGVYNAIKKEITQQAPEYSKVMKGYSTASDTIKEIERALSLGNKASADTAMRKLQSVMRNNVNTNYGQRTELVKALEQAGGQELMPALAGQALNTAMPRGIQKALTGTGGAGLALTGNIPAAAGLAAISSPRLMGEAFYGAGKAAGSIDPRTLEMLSRAAVKTAPIAGSQMRN